MRVLILTEEMGAALEAVSEGGTKMPAAVALDAEGLSAVAARVNGIVGGDVEKVIEFAEEEQAGARNAGSEGKGVVAGGATEVGIEGEPLRLVLPRRLADGRLILNADLLEDESAGAWREILTQAIQVTLTAVELA